MGLLRRLMPLATEVATADLVSIPSYADSPESQVAALSPSIAEAFGINTTSDTVTRKEAMTIPAVRRGRHIIASSLGTTPLIATRTRAGTTAERVERRMLAQPDPNTTRQWVITWTVDDLLFYGVSWWRVTEREALGYPLHTERLAPHRVVVDTTSGVVRVDGTAVPERDLIRFDGPDEGILYHGARALRTYILLEEAVRKFSRLDIPLGVIQDELGQLTEEEVVALLDSWEAARKTRTTGYIPHGLTYNNPAFNAEQIQLGEAREFQSQEIARLLNLPASSINAPTNDSLTYSTTESARRELVDLTLAPFMTAIELRLSMGDITPTGTTVAFDLSQFLKGDMAQVISNAATAVAAKLMTVDEARAKFLDMPPMEESPDVDQD